MFKSLIARILLLCCATMSSFILLFVAANQYAIHRMRAQVVSSQEALLKLYADQMDQMLDALRLSMVQAVGSDVPLNALSFLDPASTRYKLSVQQCRQQLNRNLLANPLAQTQFLYAANSATLLTASKTMASARHNYLSSHISPFLLSAAGGASSAWNCVYTYGYAGDAPAWALCKAIRASPQVTLGAVVLLSDLIPPLKSAMAYEGMATLVYGQDGALLVRTALQEEVLRDLSQSLGQAEGPVWIKSCGERYVAISRPLRTAPIRVVSLLPERGMLQQLSFFRRVGQVLPFLLAAMALATVLALPKIYRPFNDLVRAMEQVAKGDYGTRLAEGRTAEFKRVNQHFNEMVVKIGQLNQDVREQTARTHRAELRHLQAQINPHFYQNTLNLIYNLAALQQYDLIQRTALYLADYFRFIMHSGDRMISLGDELTHIKNYMELQKIRYPGAISYAAQSPPELDSYPVLPLLIQPFVENSVIHGFTPQRPFCVWVRCSLCAGGALLVEIEDNGTGLRAETTLQLNSLMQESGEDAGRHIGIWNVVTRLKRHYGQHADLCFASGAQGGTLVRLTLPAVRRDGHDVADRG